MATSAVVYQSAEYLVDLFLSDDPSLNESHFFGEGEVEIAGHDGDVVAGDDGDVVPRVEEIDEIRTAKLGRDLKYCGDELHKKYTRVNHRSLSDDVKTLFNDMVKEAGGDPETFWPKFRDMMDHAVKDTGLEEPAQVIGAVLVSVRGLQYLGSSVRNFALRYIGEKKLDDDLKKMMSKNESHLSQDP